MKTTYSKITQLCMQTAMLAGDRALTFRKRSQPDAISKGSGGRDIVTNGDKMAQEIIVASLHDVYPNIPIVAEEQTNDGIALLAPEKFVVDPIDGTSNYQAGSPHWGTTIAYIADGAPRTGVINLPALQQLIMATENAGCSIIINGGFKQPTPMSPNLLLEECIIGMEWGFWLDDRRSQRQATLARTARGTHASLSALVSISELLQGFTHAYVNLHVPTEGACIWDFAAGAIALKERTEARTINDIIRTPTGDTVDWSSERMEVVMAYPGLMDQVLAVLNS